MSTPAASTTPAPRARHGNLYAHHLWRQQRFFAGFLVVIGVAMTSLLVYQNWPRIVDGNFTQFFKSTGVIWLLYIPTGLALGGAVLFYRWRSHVEATENGVKISTLRHNVLIDYDSIRSVKVQPLNNHFQDNRKRMVAPIMKQLIDKPALFIRVRGTDEELAPIQRRLGARLMHEDTIAIPVNDADAAAWSITAHLPERVGQNLGGGKRRKRRR